MKVVVGRTFEREAKRLIKKYRSLSAEIADLFESLEINPELGTPINREKLFKNSARHSKQRTRKAGRRKSDYLCSGNKGGSGIAFYL
jgi:hypothetical protein